MLTIIDYGMGNLGSIKNMFKKIGCEALITSDINQIESATKLVLPGVGAFDHGMKHLQELNLIDVLAMKVLSQKTPFLGICLGMQLLGKSSEEGQLPGLAWIAAEAKRFNFTELDKKLPVPHMAWNLIRPKKQSILLKNMHEDARFYFVHSYHVVSEAAENCLATTNYGYEFVSMVERENIFGVQFHPEKSHRFGMQLLKNFVELA